MKNSWQIKDKILDLDKKTYVMGILNVTPDSFSDGGIWNCPEKALERALEIESQGADILDIGAQSTRPGCTVISQEEELNRLIPVLSILRGKLSIPISVDTFYPEVARKAIELGVDIINDVSGFGDENMFRVVADADCGCVVMHNKIGVDLMPFFREILETANKFGIDKNRICFDPGIGFSKTYEENLFILKNLKSLCLEECGVLVGASRKSVIGQSCGNPPAKERVAGTIAAHTIAIAGGANIIRVHDVKEAVQACHVADAILKSS